MDSRSHFVRPKVLGLITDLILILLALEFSTHSKVEASLVLVNNEKVVEACDSGIDHRRGGYG